VAGNIEWVVGFDGVKFVPYAPPELNLPTRGFTFLLGARDGSLWIGMRRGLSRLKDGRLQVYTKPDDNSGISTILEDRQGMAPNLKEHLMIKTYASRQILLGIVVCHGRFIGC
jgi:ligand-binding sensor domain-containing protein